MSHLCVVGKPCIVCAYNDRVTERWPDILRIVDRIETALEGADVWNAKVALDRVAAALEVMDADA